LGRLVVQGLKVRIPASDVVALVRTPARAGGLGVAAREADYERPETLGTALAGVETLLLVSSNEIGKRASQHRNVLDAAKQAGVKRLVYTSLLRADSSPLILAGEHQATESAIVATGLPFTILRNGWYTENYMASVPGAVANGAFIGSAGNGRISSAARADYADAAVAVLTSAGHDGKTYELAGDGAYTLAELANEISRQLGKDLPYRNLPEADFAAILTSVGLPAPMAAAYASFDVSAARGALFDDGRQLSTLIGRPTTPLSASVATALEAIAGR
jgi:NAD(P)H dehydrogenase (quinone)